MKKKTLLLVLSILLFACCGSRKFHRDSADRSLICDALARRAYSAELMEAAIRFQEKDTFCLALALAVDKNTPRRADSILHSAINRYYNASAALSSVGKKTSMKRVKAVVARKYLRRGDKHRAQFYLASSMRDTVPSCVPVVKSMERTAHKTAAVLTSHGDYKSAIDTYIRHLELCDSTIIALAKTSDEKLGRLKSDLANLLFILAFIAVAVGGAFFYDRITARHHDEEEEYLSVISSLQASSADYEQMLADLEAQQTDNRREVDMLHRQIDKIQDTMMQRMQGGKIIYSALLRGERMPYEPKDADGYLIDYVMLFFPEKYRRWQQEYVRLTPRSLTYLILSDMGHDDRAVQHILSISASSVRSIKSRLNACRAVE